MDYSPENWQSGWRKSKLGNAGKCASGIQEVSLYRDAGNFCIH
ncbi:hypothetical protein SAMD00020551_0924 [Mesobacillus selenatarsenatis SF-1]|uniref:Uncharacterized protein n=1 Tax=Mesobacillus selenatarsenatis (strain DSM 18680 / JCM 14380 / FERM P-15431 / SF-1) TaxID=1321606 RepID=A0A0A8X0M9_MESS1|nr:hypothetical protein SAMD00020551_0924 [Mesobacillus selenatarsenatis SF-1]